MVIFKGETKCRSLISEKTCQIKQHDNLVAEGDCPVRGDFDQCPLRADRGNIEGRPCLFRRYRLQNCSSEASIIW